MVILFIGMDVGVCVFVLVCLLQTSLQVLSQQITKTTSTSSFATQLVVINLLRDCIGSQKILKEERIELESRKILVDGDGLIGRMTK